MKIEFKEESNKLIITKTSFEELKKIKKKRIYGYIFFSSINLYFFIQTTCLDNIFIALISCIIIGLMFAGFIDGIYNQVKYIYCEEILILSLNDIEIKYILEEELLFSKKINYKDINKIYTKVDHRNPYLRGKTKKAENIVLSQYFEDIRSLKIKLSSNEIYTWGSEIKEEDIYQVLLNIDKYIKKFNILKAYV
ncbi:MAG: hypothetical protein ACLUBL_12030 [Fusobacterium sp.]|uniref:hypothetical protein n=2 Tax=Fusobacterium sp. TaxID=68766 RepID=UPI003992886F